MLLPDAVLAWIREDWPHPLLVAGNPLLSTGRHIPCTLFAEPLGGNEVIPSSWTTCLVTMEYRLGVQFSDHSFYRAYLDPCVGDHQLFQFCRAQGFRLGAFRLEPALHAIDGNSRSYPQIPASVRFTSYWICFLMLIFNI